jgi:hypothetical protein
MSVLSEWNAESSPWPGLVKLVLRVRGDVSKLDVDVLDVEAEVISAAGVRVLGSLYE